MSAKDRIEGVVTSPEANAALRDPAAIEVLTPAAGGTAGTVDSSAGAIRRENLRLLMHSTAFWIGALLLFWWVVCAVLGNSFSPFNPVHGSLASFNAAPSGAHWFGTDSLG